MNQLTSTVLIRKELEISAVDSISSDGFLNLNNDNIEHIKSLFNYDLIEVMDFDKVNSILINDIDNNTNAKNKNNKQYIIFLQLFFISLNLIESDQI